MVIVIIKMIVVTTKIALVTNDKSYFCNIRHLLTPVGSLYLAV